MKVIFFNLIKNTNTNESKVYVQDSVPIVTNDKLPVLWIQTNLNNDPEAFTINFVTKDKE